MRGHGSTLRGFPDNASLIASAVGDIRRFKLNMQISTFFVNISF